jgi:hypothetical protein
MRTQEEGSSKGLEKSGAMRSVIVHCFATKHQDDNVMEWELVGECSTHGREEACDMEFPKTVDYLRVLAIDSLDSSVSIGTRYSPGIECRWGRDFPQPILPALVTT